MAKVVRFEELKKTKFNEKGERQIMTGQKAMLVKNTVYPGFPSFRHRHPHEQILTIFSGTADVTVGDETFRMGPGDMIYVPPNTVHDFRVVGDETVINYDIFAPVREDFLMMLSKDVDDDNSIKED
ncbi:MAG: cupin domain-containing protein [Anaerovoracaceae bacterium]|nr:cupin domain-containing protein [Anaerovoracaceae bacterium]